MKIGCLTSSRADYGIYLPLLKKLRQDDFFTLEIIAFGTHTSPFHGYTLNDIVEDDFEVIHQISTLLLNDSAQSVATAYGLTALKFADFWQVHNYDIVLCLGDRYEMSAAVQAGIPFNIKFAHLHGGETTLGATDNIYRHQITLASAIHFAAAEAFSEKIAAITGSNDNIYTTGSISLDELSGFDYIPESEFREKYGIRKDFLLVTFHPETASFNENEAFAEEMYTALAELADGIDIVITMPNADTEGTIYREKILQLKNVKKSSVLLIENFGKKGYFSAMKYAKAMLGNTSSGIIEAASFGKFAVNVGDRQKGRLQSGNVLNATFNASDIVAGTETALNKGMYSGENAYYKAGAANTIVEILKTL